MIDTMITKKMLMTPMMISDVVRLLLKLLVFDGGVDDGIKRGVDDVVVVVVVGNNVVVVGIVVV